MKQDLITCELVQDLLPLYEDGCCSEQSRKIVEQHLKECESCKKKYQQSEEKLPEMKESEVIDAKKIKRSMRKINRWRIIGTAVLCLTLTFFLIIIPAWNYANGRGITYTNLKQIYITYSFEKALASNDYEKAYHYLDIKGHYNDLITTNISDPVVKEGIQEIEAKGFEWYDKVAKEKFLKNMETLESMNEMVHSYNGFNILKQPYGWDIRFEDVKTTSGQGLVMHLEISSDGISNFYVFINDVRINSNTGEIIKDDKIERKELMFDRLYTSPTLNESVMEMLYNETDYDWTKLFEY